MRRGGDSKGSTLSFEGVVALFVEGGVLQSRVEIWRRKMESLGGKRESHLTRRLTHVFASSPTSLLHRVDSTRLRRLRKLKVTFLKYDWLEGCLKAGQRLAEEPYNLFLVSRSSADDSADSATESLNSDSETHKYDLLDELVQQEPTTSKKSEKEHRTLSNEEEPKEPQDVERQKETYTPPNLNENITGPFEELKDIYKDALGDKRRSFSYQKAVSWLEKLPYKITSVDQVKNAPTIGKSLQEHIQEILTTGKLAKLEHFKNDEKVKTVSLFGSVWGIGPSTALSLYEKGYRSLEELSEEESLSRSQRLGLKFYDDIKTRILRSEAGEMEKIVQIIGESIQPGISILCGGSYRRGKATIGDLDMVVTHPDGVSHKRFLRRLVSALKETGFLTEDLLIAYHEEPNDHGVDTYFGLCRYPGGERRHRIDFKVYSREQYPFGLIAWTGNDVLNRRLRLLARGKGYKLDDKGLYKSTFHEKKKHKVGNKNVSVACKDEREVFEFLGHPWLEPNERNL